MENIGEMVLTCSYHIKVDVLPKANRINEQLQTYYQFNPTKRNTLQNIDICISNMPFYFSRMEIV